ncbi:holin-associated N-acetylmuramidase [Phaeobacter sp. 11ANDIMAR09]|uniref:holin-associated N-acetylmuramidase n=1 Tax=Phaeobacter sp. 11ANDIMAR09 TaxID=1225647 RepID=UPI0006C88A9B|nr:holin-associated N-acetylmuramidase [Phaeobacter sp. 11ANDIMAR09]KPD10375.1 peptidoglycan-binding protein [Phaeobacter sp. 11ANDIMAR09]
MQSPKDIALEIVRREGSFVNDRDDPGGATNRGVTIHTMRRLGLDLDGDGDVDVADVKLVSVDLAVDIYLRHYFHRPKIAQLPEPIQASVFDMYVNAGSNAVKILQRLINETGTTDADLAVDGGLGPLTISAVTRAHDQMGAFLVDAYGIARRDYYYSLADRRAKSRKYARRRDGGKGGWITRAEDFIRPRYHLTDADHRARCAAWG